MGAGLSRYLGLFVQETSEQLEAFGLAVARLEREGHGLDELFRLAHSIKGSAGAMGFGAIAELAHHLEALLERMPEAGPDFSKEAIDLLYRTGSRLGEMVSLAAGGGLPGAASELIEDLARLESKTASEKTETWGWVGRPGGSRAEELQAHPLVVEPLAPLRPLHATTRIRTDALDDLLDEAGDLVLAVARLLEETKGSASPSLERGLGSLQRRSKQLHAKVLTARLTPVAALADRLQTLVRSVARSLGKEVTLELSGAELELDRSVLDGLVDPLGHLLRNCVHHGIEAAGERAAAGKGETGLLRLIATRSRDRMTIVVEDDGRGMDPEHLRRRAGELGLVPADVLATMSSRQALLLCCLPGLSTAAEVTEVSGRGVGMDQVTSSVERLGGSLAIDSVKGVGTRFRLELPLGISVVQVLLVGVADQIYALPLSRVVSAGIGVEGRDRLPLHRLQSLLDGDPPPLAPADPPKTSTPFVIVDVDDARVALEVDRLVGYEEAVLKPLSPPLDRVIGVSGTLLLGTGRPVFLLDAKRLLSSRAAVSDCRKTPDPRKEAP